MGQSVQSIFYRIGNFFILYIVLLGCARIPNPNNQLELITILQQDQPGLQNVCEAFVRTENICVGSGANVNLICNGSLQTRLRNHIQPIEKRTDSILEMYFRCFDSCNRNFNLMSNCQQIPFSTNDIYRRDQRRLAILESQSIRGIASVQWNDCYDRCRSVNGKEPPETSHLRGSGTTFPLDWFMEN